MVVCTATTSYTPAIFWQSSFLLECTFKPIHQARSSASLVGCHLQRQMDAPLESDKSDKSKPCFASKCCTENKIHQYWRIRFSSVYFSYRNSQFYILTLFVQNKTRSFFRTYWSCFAQGWTCWSLDRDSNASKDHWHRLTHWAGVKLAGFIRDKIFACICWFSIRSSINN